MAQSQKDNTKQGFTIIEVMLVLAISGLLLIGAIGGTYSSIRAQRYKDSVSTFAESLRQVYNEVLNPRSSQSANSSKSVFGKIIVFGLNSDAHKYYTATIAGSAEPPTSDNGFIGSLANRSASIDCSTVTEHTLSWDSQVYKDSTHPFSGVIVIARSPSSGAVHTASYDVTTFDIANNCSSAKTAFQITLSTAAGSYSMDNATNFCIKSEDASVLRAVQISADGANTSAVSILDQSQSIAVGCQ